MNLKECFQYFASRQEDGVVITSAGVTSGTWWRTTHDMDRVFYLGASMSMISMFGAGIAMGAPKLPVWVFMGDGAFVMNPGMLMVERDLDLPNLKHFLVSNRVITPPAPLPFPTAAAMTMPLLPGPSALRGFFTSTPWTRSKPSLTRSCYNPATPSPCSRSSRLRKNQEACPSTTWSQKFVLGAISRRQRASRSFAIRQLSRLCVER